MINEVIEKRRIGVNFSEERKATVLVWAPLASSVEIDIRGKTIFDLYPKERGYWILETTELQPGDQYLFKIDNQNSFPDPASLMQSEGVHNYSRAFDLSSFRWHDQNWKGIKEDELIIYELHTGTFSPEGTFKSLCSYFNYFKELGITAVEIMPVAQFPGSRNWGYDGVYPFAVQYSYGGPEGLQELVDIFHRENIAVILDVVYNHLGPEGNYLGNFGPYFTDKYKTPWGNAINFDDEWSDGVRRYYIENALMWLRDFHVDGLRLDAVHAIKDFGANHILLDIKEHVNELNKKSLFKHFMIGESDLNDVRYINSPDKGGYGLDHQWADEFHHSIHALVTGEKNGYYSDFGSIELLKKSFTDAFVYDGLYSSHRKRTFGNTTRGQTREKFIVFSQNHDQIGNRIRGERLSVLVDFETLKLIAGTVFISPFIPMIFMGEEYGETNPFLYFISHGDEKLIHLIRDGRKKEFKDFFHSDDTFHDPQSEETFYASKLNIGEKPEGRKAKMFAYYKELIRIKKQHSAVKDSRWEEMSTTVVQPFDILLHIKKTGKHLFLAIMNFEYRDFLIDFKCKDTIHLLLNSAEEKWRGEKMEKADNSYLIDLNDFVNQESSDLNKDSFPPVQILRKSIMLFSDTQV